jgi:hypothetical protein
VHCPKWSEGRLVPKQNETRRREKKLLELSGADQKLVSDFVASLGTLSRARIDKYENHVGKLGFELGRLFMEVTSGELVDYLNGASEDDYSEETKRDVRLISNEAIVHELLINWAISAGLFNVGKP